MTTATTTAERLDLMPPEADDIERQLLGSLMVDPQRIDAVNKIIGRDDFRTDRHRHLSGDTNGQPVSVGSLWGNTQWQVDDRLT